MIAANKMEVFHQNQASMTSFSVTMRILGGGGGANHTKTVTRLPSLIIPTQGQCHHQELCTALAGKFISNHPTISWRNDMITIAVYKHSRSPDKKGTFGTERMNKKSNRTVSFKDIQRHGFWHPTFAAYYIWNHPHFFENSLFSFPPPKNKKHQRFGTQWSQQLHSQKTNQPTNGGSCNEITLIIKSKEAMTPTNVQIQELNQPQRQRSVVGW